MNNLTSWLIQKKMTQVALGELLGISSSIISRVASGQLEPSRNFLERFYEAFGAAEYVTVFGPTENSMEVQIYLEVNHGDSGV